MRHSLRFLGALVVSGLVAAACGQGDQQDRVNAREAAALTAGTAEVTLDKNSDWKDGYCANVLIKNMGSSTITSWKVLLDLHESKVNNLWSAIPTTSGSELTVTPFTWNATITPGNTVVFGFCADKTGADYVPVLVSAETTVAEPGTGGATGSGGASGGASAGGTAAGGTETGGTAGTESGGTAAGGTETGGIAAGGTEPGGTAGTESGGTAAGGTETGGTAAGGTETGGAGGIAGAGGQGGGTTNQPFATVAFQSNWGSGYCADATITNPGSETVTSWTLVLDIGQSTVSSLWSADYTAQGSLITVTPVRFNAAIPAGSSVGFGFCGTTTGTEYTPEVVSLETVTSGTGTGGNGAGGNGAGGTSSGGAATGGTAAGGTASGGSGTGGAAPSLGTATLTISSEWAAGYCGNVKVVNQSSATTITSWTVALELGRSTVSSLWSAAYTTSGTRVTATPLSYNSKILPGGSADFGFCANKNGSSDLASLYSFDLATGS